MVSLQKLQDALNKAEGTQKLGALAMANLGTQVALTAITLPAPVLGMPIMAGGIAVNAAALGPMNEEMSKEEAKMDLSRSNYFEKQVSQDQKGAFLTNWDRDWHTGAHCDPQREFNKDNSQGCAPMNEVIRMNHLEELPINKYGRRILPDNDKPVVKRSNKPPKPPAPPLPAVRPDPTPRDSAKVPVSEGEIFTVGVIGLGVAAAVAVAVR